MKKVRYCIVDLNKNIVYEIYWTKGEYSIAKDIESAKVSENYKDVAKAVRWCRICGWDCFALGKISSEDKIEIIPAIVNFND